MFIEEDFLEPHGTMSSLAMEQCLATAILPGLIFENISALRVPLHTSVNRAEQSTKSTWESASGPVGLISIENCLDRVGTTSDRTITIFTAGAVETTVLNPYITHVLGKNPDLDRSQILTWDTIFGDSWLSNATSSLPPSYSWIPEARSYYVLASRTIDAVHLLMPFRRNHADPYQDGRGTPWTSYIYPTLSRNPSISSISVIDPTNFSRRRVIWRQRDASFRRPVNCGSHILSPNTTDATLLYTIIEEGDVIPSTPYPTVFWSSLCEDTETCLDRSEAVVTRFISEHLDGKGVHWFALPTYLGSNPILLDSHVLAPYLSISPDSPCFQEIGPAAVLEAEMAQGVAYVILRRDADLERASKGVKKTCWWCECELSILTRNLKVSEVVRVDLKDFGRQSVVWKRGMPPLGRDPKLRS